MKHHQCLDSSLSCCQVHCHHCLAASPISRACCGISPETRQGCTPRPRGRLTSSIERADVCVCVRCVECRADNCGLMSRCHVMRVCTCAGSCESTLRPLQKRSRRECRTPPLRVRRALGMRVAQSHRDTITLWRGFSMSSMSMIASAWDVLPLRHASPTCARRSAGVDSRDIPHLWTYQRLIIPSGRVVVGALGHPRRGSLAFVMPCGSGQCLSKLGRGCRCRGLFAPWIANLM